MFDDIKPVVGLYSEPPLACRDFDPRATEIARQVAAIITRHIASLRVDHVGSTAVPGCGGPGAIDLLVTAGESELPAADALLKQLGFQPWSDAPFPPGSPAYRGVWEHNGEAFPLHAFLLAGGAAEIDSLRFLRSCLRSDAELTKAYVAQKKAILAGGVKDQAEYDRQKAEFLKMVLG